MTPSPNFVLVYSYADQSPNWYATLPVLAFFVACAIIWLIKTLVENRGLPRLHLGSNVELSFEAVPAGFLAFCIFFTACFTIVNYGSDKQYRAQLASGETNQITGEVSHFVPMPAAGHSPEKFCVKTACFSYSDFSKTGTFNHTASHGGPIRAGETVRITYIGNAILKLEIASPVSTSKTGRPQSGVPG